VHIFPRSKKANAPFDVATILIIIVMLGIVSVIGYMIFDEMNTDVQADLDLTEAKEVSSGLYGNYAELLDNIFLFVFVLLLLFTIVSVFLLDTHPIFFIVSVILLISVFLATILLANVYDDVMSDDSLSSYANSFNYTSWLMQNILPVMIATGFIVMAALFAKFKMA